MMQTLKRFMAVPAMYLSLGLMGAVVQTTGCTEPSTSGTTSTTSSSGGDTCSLGRKSCRVARECGGGFECQNAADGLACNGDDCCCTKVICESDADCEPPETCDLRRNICRVKECNPEDCPPGQICINSTDDNGNPVSQCGDPGEITADKCVMDVANFSLTASATRQLRPVGLKNSGAQVPAAQFTYTSSAAGVASVDNNGVVTGVASGDATITATPVGGSGTCTASVHVYGAVGANDVRAVVFNSRTGKPMTGVKVQLRKTDNTATTLETSATGDVTFTGGGPAADIKDISAFPEGTPGYTWVTYVAPGTNDVAFYVDPLKDESKVAGVTGTFDTSLAQPPKGDIKLGLAAFSIAGALSDLNLESLVGRTVPTDISIPSVSIDEEDVPLPGGVYLKLNTEDIKTRVDVYADGPCTTEDPCNRILWGLGGQVALNKIAPIISDVAGGDNINAGAILGAVLPFFRKFYHYVQGGISVVDQAAPATPDALPNFPQNDIVVKPAYLLSRVAPFTIPTLPSLPEDASQNLSGALVLTGSYVPGQGFVPLGVTAGLDVCENSETSECTSTGAANGKVTCADDTGTPDFDECADNGLAEGDLAVDYAPPHDGLEGYRLATVALALDINSLGSGALFTSVLVSFNDSLPEDSKTTFPAGTFLQFNKGSWSTTSRTYTGTTRVDGADFYRLNLDTADKSWIIYAAPSGSGTFTIEVPPLPDGVTEVRTANQDIQAFRLFDGAGMPESLSALAAFNSTNFDNLVLYNSAFNTQECAVRYPARECANDAQCAEGFDDGYTCDSGAGVCVNATAGVTVKSGTCPENAPELTVNGKSVCSRIPACEVVSQ
ncbi:MAG: Ig-like domain-containing protein [Myxococcota bacterium]